MLKNKLEGIGWFTFEIFSRVVRNHPEVEFYFLFDREYDDSFVFEKNVTPIVVSPQARHPILFRVWFNWSVKKALKKIQPDLFISPDGYLSLTTDVKQLAVIHDLNFEHFPGSMPKKNLNYYKKYFPLFARKATRIATVSETSKMDISMTYNVDSNKIDVVYNSAGDNYFEIQENEKLGVRDKLTDGKPYFVFVGSINERKNPVRLIQAFDLFKDQTKSEMKLVFVGSKMWNYPDFDDAYHSMNFQDDVVFTGHISQKRLNEIVSASRALAFVSYFEGFGIPLVEAMKSRTAIVASNYSVMPEICRESALYVDPFNVNDIAEKLTEIASDDSLRDELISKGDKQQLKYSWDDSAEKMWKIIKKTIEC